MEIIVKNFDENNKKDRSRKTTKKAKDKVDKNNKSDVEQVRRTLQLVSQLVNAYPKKSAMNFPNFWHEVKNRYYAQTDRAGLSIKNLVHP